MIEKEIYSRLKSKDFAMLKTLLTERSIAEFSEVNKMSRQTAKKFLDKYHSAVLIDESKEEIGNFTKYSYKISELGKNMLSKKKEKENAE